MTDNEQLLEVAMTIISASGAGRSASFEALAAAKNGDFAEADRLMTEADDCMTEAHSAHSELLKMDAKGEIPQEDILLAHAQDHFMCGSLAHDLSAEIIELYKRLDKAGK